MLSWMKMKRPVVKLFSRAGLGDDNGQVEHKNLDNKKNNSLFFSSVCIFSKLCCSL